MAEPKDQPEPTRAQRPVRSRNLDAVEARNKAAQVIRIFCTVIAVILALGAILIAFQNNVNPNNGLVSFVKSVAEIFDGPFSLQNGLFVFSGDNAAIKSALVNWGIAAVVWLAIGRILDRIIRVGT
ncbi:hypothetical protein GCM10011519_11980 [Marmoricola endophyticus]|uniref:Uncharacterized protein n=1 Tax=Marmoricola endophyticus TaxID=2040280 RepID=A0A917F136_9ACTN|nr:hypothetical protein [Marmoricola endophyticus]GGF39910.1 hypothetical protein GCM10011519_11980 [Marmoricola endophyticus]